MTERTKAEILEELEATKESLAKYKEYMRVVAHKARADRHVGDVLFNTIRQYKKGLQNGE